MKLNMSLFKVAGFCCLLFVLVFMSILSTSSMLNLTGIYPPNVTKKAQGNFCKKQL